MEPVTVRAACHDGRIAQMLHLSMVAFIIGLCGNQEDLIPFHHFPVGMTFLADLGMELFSGCDDLWLVAFQDGNFVEAMAIGAGGRIRIAGEDGFAVEAV